MKGSDYVVELDNFRYKVGTFSAPLMEVRDAL